ncbi:MAG: DUF1207 domain-containing protein [Syntrophaceae bacterium]|nr:DUF1207 domain-containing protein [Syntrophaceae bacterium]
MRKIFPGLFLAAFLPFTAGFSEMPADENIEQSTINEPSLFPQGQLFYPPMANPKEPRTHVTYLRLNLPDDSINIGSVGFGDSFGLVRWPGWGKEDAWQISISGAALAQFNLDSKSIDLINADYIIGIPLSYRNGPWSARVRIFHQSSHLGDEFLLLPQIPELKVTRINLSFETIELLGACELKGFQFTAGPSCILHTDSDLKRYSIQAGIDYQSRKPFLKPTIRPFVGLLHHAWEETDWNPDLNVKVGVNIRTAEKRAVQAFGEYHHGNLPFGQFYKLRAEYYGVGINVSY